MGEVSLRTKMSYGKGIKKKKIAEMGHINYYYNITNFPKTKWFKTTNSYSFIWSCWMRNLEMAYLGGPGS